MNPKKGFNAVQYLYFYMMIVMVGLSMFEKKGKEVIFL